MIQLILKYLRVYKEFLSNCFSEASSYRVHFFGLIIMDLIFYFSTIAGVDILYHHVETIGTWHREEFMFFLCFMLCMDHLHMTFISESFWELSHKIRTGGLDYELLRPVHLLFNLFFRHIRPATMINVTITWSLLYYFAFQVGLSAMNLFILPPLCIAGMFLLLFVEIVICSVMFYTVENFGINFLRLQLQAVARWPDFIYNSGFRFFFVVLFPVLTVGNAPAHFILDNQPYWLLWMFIALVLWAYIAKFCFFKALRSYESASS